MTNKHPHTITTMLDLQLISPAPLLKWFPYNNLLLPEVLISMVLVARGQPEFENIKWEISEINN